MDREITYSEETGVYIVRCFITNQTRSAPDLSLALKYLTAVPIVECN
jgi:hypothetical protein